MPHGHNLGALHDHINLEINAPTPDTGVVQRSEADWFADVKETSAYIGFGHNVQLGASANSTFIIDVENRGVDLLVTGMYAYVSQTEACRTSLATYYGPVGNVEQQTQRIGLEVTSAGGRESQIQTLPTPWYWPGNDDLEIRFDHYNLAGTTEGIKGQGAVYLKPAKGDLSSL